MSAQNKISNFSSFFSVSCLLFSERTSEDRMISFGYRGAHSLHHRNNITAVNTVQVSKLPHASDFRTDYLCCYNTLECLFTYLGRFGLEEFGLQEPSENEESLGLDDTWYIKKIIGISPQKERQRRWRFLLFRIVELGF